MDCRTFHKNLEDYLEERQDFSGRFGMERHAQQCFGCANDLTAAQRLGQMARELKRVPAPPDFEAGVLNKIHSRSTHRALWKLHGPWVYGWDWSWLRPATVGTVALILLGLGVIPSNHRGKNSHQISAPVVSQVDGADPAKPPAGTLIRGTKPMEANLSSTAGTGPSIDQALPVISAEPADADYVEYMVPGPDNRQIIMRLPRTIRMRYGQPSEEYFIQNVSH